MDGNIQKALWLGVSVLMFVGVVIIGMSIYSSGQEMASQGAAALDSTSRQLTDTKYSMYDNKEVSGSDVISAINLYKKDGGEIQITVTNNSAGATATQYVSSGDPTLGTLADLTLATTNQRIQNAQDKSNTGVYINPYGEFYATLVYDANEMVRGIDFAQR